MLAYYLHDLDPMALRVSDTWQVRWYGLSYVAGLVCAWGVLLWLARRNLSVLRTSEVASFLLFLGFCGVMIGGRAGYLVGWQGSGPGSLRAGMSSHGCIVGIVVVCVLWSRWRRVSLLGLLDSVACATAPAIFFIRLGNFINGENLGRVTQAPWAVKFPTELLRGDLAQPGGHGLALSAGVQTSPEIIAFAEQAGLGRAGLAILLSPRHPVQLYEGVGAGLLLFLMIMVLRVRFPKLRPGLLAVLACLWYGAVRIIVECLRQPEAWEISALGMTKGQWYSTYMLGIGLVMLAGILRGSKLPCMK